LNINSTGCDEAIHRRGNADTDEIWLVQHPPTYTQGQAGKPEHLLHQTNIPVVKIDRGGQITYHGPGQIVAYLLLDLHRWKINVRELVRLMEHAHRFIRQFA
jgi:lipoyl(octanoyl) transferase